MNVMKAKSPAGTPGLRDYQIHAIKELSKYKRPLLVMPTGGGKTVVACAIMKAAVAKGQRVLFIVHRRELVNQTSRKLDDFGVVHGIVMGNDRRHNSDALVQIASIQTLARRNADAKYDLIIVDESHHAVAQSYRAAIKANPDARVVGLSATPVRADGEGLKDLFTVLVQGTSIGSLTKEGFLVPVKAYAPSIPDLAKVKMSMGDFDERASAGIMDKPTLIGSIVETWKRLAMGRATVCFSVNVAHSQHIRDSFLEAGIKAAHLDAKTPIDERDQILDDLASGKIQIVTNCMVLTEGWDSPSVSCCIIARPTMSEGLFLQMAGRVLRPYPGKVDAVLLDHAGCVIRHGLPGDPRWWSLTSKKRKALTAFVPKVITCFGCHAILKIGSKCCPECGWVPAPPKSKPLIEQKPGKLVEFKGAAREPVIKSSPWHKEHRRFYRLQRKEDISRAGRGIECKNGFRLKSLSRMISTYRE